MIKVFKGLWSKHILVVKVVIFLANFRSGGNRNIFIDVF